jgi:GH24 family phage-related lysozyme (muramidase)
MTSFVYNLGEGALDGKSTQIAKHINNKKWQMAAAGMMFYIKDNGVIFNGLIKRRCEEASYLIKG